MAAFQVCKFCGSSNIEVTPRLVTCKRCHMEYENTGNTSGTKGNRRRRNRRNQPSPQPETPRDDGTKIPIFVKHEEDKASGPQYVRIVDFYEYVDENGEERTEITHDLDFKVLDEKYVPDLKIDAAKAEFFRWLYRDLVKKEKRYGRDYLRRKGVVPVGKVEDRGKIVTLYTHEDDVEEAKMLYDIDPD